MRSHVRTIVVLALAARRCVALFLHNVDLWRRGGEIARARPAWLALSLATMFVEPGDPRRCGGSICSSRSGAPTFANAFRATAVGFAASRVLPARAGEVIRPYFLARGTRRA